MPQGVSSHFGLQDPRLQSVVMPMILPLNLTAATILTPAQVLQGFLIVNAAAGVNITLPSAAAMVQAVQGAMVGTAFEVELRSMGAGTATLVMGTGGTMSGTATVATLNTRTFWFNFTNVTYGQEAYTVYSKGTAAY